MVYDICFGQRPLNLGRNFDAQFFKLARNQRAWANQRDARAELKQPEDVRARDAAKENVTDDCDMQSCDFSSAFAHCVKIKKRLSRMFVRAIAGVDYACFESTCQELRSARGTVTKHENIGVQSLQIACGVFECLALRQTGCGCGDIDYVCAQAKCRQLERCARSSAWFSEEVDQRFSTKRRNLFDLARADLFKRVRCFENEADFVS